MSPSRFGELLQRLRLAAGLSQSELARRASLHPAHINRLERGARPAQPSPEAVAALCAGLDADPDAADALFHAAGFCPPSLARLPEWEPVLGALARRLCSPDLAEEDRADLVRLLAALARCYASSR